MPPNSFFAPPVFIGAGGCEPDALGVAFLLGVGGRPRPRPETDDKQTATKIKDNTICIIYLLISPERYKEANTNGEPSSIFPSRSP
jgi:hypothetical protein